MLKPFMRTLCITVLFSLTTIHTAVADSHADQAPDLKRLMAALGGTEPDSVAETPIDGVYEVVIGTQIIYISTDGRFAIQGDVIDLASASNLTENRMNGIRKAAIDNIGTDGMITFAPETATQHAVTVFTDIDCGYCRKLHQEISAYNEQGIAIQYLMFPRAGLKSESYQKAVSAWCADDAQTALTQAKLGQDITRKECTNPVTEHYKLGQQLGVRGTPSIILPDGKMVPGYVPAQRLAKMLANR